MGFGAVSDRRVCKVADTRIGARLIQLVKRMKLHALKIKRTHTHAHTTHATLRASNVIPFLELSISREFVVAAVVVIFCALVFWNGLPTRRNMLFAMFNNSILWNILLTDYIQFNLCALVFSFSLALAPAPGFHFHSFSACQSTTLRLTYSRKPNKQTSM